ncbi:MAG TPA: UbiD family decarboxylase, partial [Chloroflexota bacterium]|nr:UbiD family decarboxylase [Chloroflexota bacterium]
MTYHRDLRAFLVELEARGKLYRFQEPIDKDRELLPLMRVQLRGLPDEARKVLLFENVRSAGGQQYDMQVVGGVYGLTEQVVALGMGCESPNEMLERWHAALDRPLPPRLVDGAPVHEEVHTGDELTSVGLDEIPVPLEDPGFSQVIRTGLPMITRDPDTGIANVGTYNGFFRDRNRLVAAIGGGHDAMRYHWQAARRRKEEMPLAIVVGATPNVMLVGSAPIPYGMDELAVAGGLVGQPLEVAACKTVPLEVPATAEIVIEGFVSTDVLEPRLAFGEYPGYLNMERNNRPVMRVTAITHRKNALFTPVLVGFAPSDTNVVWGSAIAGVLYHQLRYEHQLPVQEVFLPQIAGGNDFCVLRMQDGSTGQAPEVLKVAAKLHKGAKYLVAVDHDIGVRDPELIIWALSFRVSPERDLTVQSGRSAGLDPSGGPTGSSRGKMETADPSRDYYQTLIDATAKGAFPPVALPAKPYMERALDIWLRQPGLPEPKLR